MTRIGEWVRRRAALAGTLGLALAAVPHGAVAQVQPAAAASSRLSEALRSLAQNPDSLASLVDAGRASLALDDVDAALGFFRRAGAIAPADGRVKAGLAAVMVRQGEPLEALRLFEEAEQAGEPMRLHAADRGLAYDLAGDNARAQQDYRVALSIAPDPRITRRLALSQAIAGDRNASEATLLPLLQQGDLAAYRTRAFALAILGEADEAVSIAQDMLPQSVSSRLAPYLRYMPRLTRAQQAAAALLGEFPQAAQIGREDPALAAAVGRGAGGAPDRGRADARLMPSGPPMGARPAAGPTAEPAATQVAVRDVEARFEAAAQTRPASTFSSPAPVALVQAAQVTSDAGQQSLSPSPPSTPAAEMIAPQPEEPRPSLALGQPAPSEPAALVPAPPERRDLSQAFAEFAAPPPRAVPAQGAVDITRIEPPRETPPEAKPAPPPKPVVPSRHWVQVGTGRNTGAFAFDWRRIKRAAGGLLDGAGAHVAAWGQTNRLVAGPFGSEREADELVSRLKEKDVDSFRFTSARGEEVRPLD